MHYRKQVKLRGNKEQLTVEQIIIQTAKTLVFNFLVFHETNKLLLSLYGLINMVHVYSCLSVCLLYYVLYCYARTVCYLLS